MSHSPSSKPWMHSANGFPSSCPRYGVLAKCADGLRGSGAHRRQGSHLGTRLLLTFLPEIVRCLHAEHRWADANGLRKLIEQSSGNPHSPFGVTHITTNNPACTQPAKNPDPTLTIAGDWAYVCSMAANAPSHPVGDASAYEFADDGHLATGAQRVLGQYLYCLAQPRGRVTVPFPKRAGFNCSIFNSLLPTPAPTGACPPVLNP